MKYSTFYLSILILCSSVISAQEEVIFDAYEAENSAYFSHPVAVASGIVASDNFASKIYLINETGISELAASAGCGRYYSVSPDGSKIGYKIISSDGLQSPAFVNVSNGKITQLASPVNQCGQTSFSQNNIAAFTIDRDLYVLDNGTSRKYDLGSYVNITPISPDGNFVAYCNSQDQLIVLDLSDRTKFQVSESGKRCIYPKWSPDGTKLVYKHMSGELIVWDKITNARYEIGKGGNPSWSSDSQFIVYHFEQENNMRFMGSDIYISYYNGSGRSNLTNSENTHEMDVSFDGSDKILYHTYNDRQIVSAKIDLVNLTLSDENLIVDSSVEVPVQFHILDNPQTKGIKSITHIPDVPYVHQNYDTPDWHAGSGSCSPTACAITLAFYNKLPKWQKTVSSPYTHTSDYGYYVADKYRFNEFYYDMYEPAYGTDAWGGYGYIWGMGSPNSYQRDYLEKHNLQSNQLWNSSVTFEQTITEIDLGYVHPMCVMLTSSGHLIVARGYVNGQHTLIFNDPYGNKNTPGYPSYDGIDAYYDWPGYNNGYQNLDYNGSYGVVAWTTQARATQPVYSDTIIDNDYYNHGFFMKNNGDSHQRYFRDANIGYNGHMWYTLTMASDTNIAWVSWTPNIPEAGEYEVRAYIPSNYATATSAHYVVNHDGGATTVIVDQSIYFDEWVSLGSYEFTSGQSGSVFLGDSTGVNSQYIAYDAMWFSKVPSTVQMNIMNVTCNGNSDGAATAVPTTGVSPYTFQWSTGDQTSTISNMPGGIYYVTVIDANLMTQEGTAEIIEPEILTTQPLVTEPSVSGGSDGIIDLNVSGGTVPYSCSWIPDISSETIADNLVSGLYDVTVTDLNSCTASASIILTDPGCDMPSGLTETQITSGTADLAWDPVQDAIGYSIRVKENSQSLWDYYYSSVNSCTVTGLVADSLHDWGVATVCDIDTSVYASDSFTAAPISNDTIISCFGKFTDSGGDDNTYANYDNYVVQIAPPGATRVRMVFESFATEAIYDILKIYDGDTAAANLIGTYDGETAGDNPGTVIAESGVMSLYFDADYSQVRDGWVAYWYADGGECSILPQTEVVAPVNEWQIDDFEAQFTDIDNSTFGLSESFYQVIDFNGTEWRADPDKGFYYDDFSQTMNSELISLAGTWDTLNGVLNQSDVNSSNTNLYFNLLQDSLSDYLFTMQMLIEDDPVNTTERAGFHIFADDSAGVERGNSYLAWFRPAEGLVQIWENINNIDYLMSADQAQVSFGVWYDVKLLYSPITGEVSVYVDDEIVSTWTDPTPFKTGKYLSLRTRYCNGSFDDIKIYRSRSATEQILVGEDISDDVQFQNTDPVTPSCRINSIVRDNLLHFSAEDGNNYNIDWTPPDDILTINDGAGADIDITNSANELLANWSVSSDTQSDIANYWWAIGTTPGGTELIGWQNNGLNTSVTATGFMTLENNTMYYVSVKAENNAGLFSNPVSSDGQLAELLPSVSFYAENTSVCTGDTVFFTNGTQNGIGYEWQLPGSNLGSSQLIEPAVTYSAAGVYDVTLIATGPAGNDTLLKPLYIEVFDTPTADFNAVTTNITLPNAIASFSNNSANSDSYLWDFGDGETSSDNTPWHLYNVAGTYTVTLIAYSSDCGSDTLILNDYITVNDATSAPSANFTYSNTTNICAGDSISFTNLSGNSTSWNWTFTGGTPFNSSDENPTVLLADGAYNVQLIAYGAGGEDTIDVQINVITIVPPVIILGSNHTACEGMAVILDAGSGFLNYEWSDGANAQTIEAVISGNYSVIATDAYGCKAGDTTDVTIFANPTPVISGDFEMCFGDTTTLDAGAGYTYYEWNSGSSAQIYSTDLPGPYSVIVTDDNGCTGEVSTLVEVYDNPAVDLGSDLILCDGDVLLLDAGSGYALYDWSTGSSNQTIDVSDAGNYQVVVTDTNGCIGEDSASVTLINQPLADFYAMEDTAMIQNGLIMFVNNSTDADAYLYDFGDGATSTDQNPYHIYTDTGSFTVTLIAYSYDCGNDTLILEDYIHILNPSNIAANSNYNTVKLFPNPFSGICFLEYSIYEKSDIQIEILDILGEHIYQQKIKEQLPGVHSQIIDLKNISLPDGTYILKFTAGENTIYKKLLLKN